MSSPSAVSKNPNKNWSNNALQFPRLIAELQAAGAFTTPVILEVADSMDLGPSMVTELIDRACDQWDKIKEQL